MVCASGPRQGPVCGVAQRGSPCCCLTLANMGLTGTPGMKWQREARSSVPCSTSAGMSCRRGQAQDGRACT